MFVVLWLVFSLTFYLLWEGVRYAFPPDRYTPIFHPCDVAGCVGRCGPGHRQGQVPAATPGEVSVRAALPVRLQRRKQV